MDVKSLVGTMAKELQAEAVAALKGQVPTAEEQAEIVWATQTLAAGTVLTGNADTREAVGKAKAILANIAMTHAIDGQAHVTAMVNSAIAKAIPIITQALILAVA